MNRLFYTGAALALFSVLMMGARCGDGDKTTDRQTVDPATGEHEGAHDKTEPSHPGEDTGTTDEGTTDETDAGGAGE